MMIDTRDTVSATDLSREAGRYITEAAGGRTLLVLRQNQPAAALVSVDRLSRIEDAEEDLRLLGVALVRHMTDSGVRHTLDEVAAEFGIDLTETSDEVE